MISAKWYVALTAALGIVGLLFGALDHSRNEMLSSLIGFGMAAFGYVFYVRRWKR